MLIVNNALEVTTLAVRNQASALIASVISLNRDINEAAVLGGEVTRLTMFNFVAARSPQAKGSHGNANLRIMADGQLLGSLISPAGLPQLRLTGKARHFWLAYAAETRAKHTGDNIPRLIEFFCPGGTATDRLLYEYVRGFFLWSSDHYVTYYLLHHDGALVRDLHGVA